MKILKLYGILKKLNENKKNLFVINLNYYKIKLKFKKFFQSIQF